MKCSVECQPGMISFSFSKICTWFSGGAKVWVQIDKVFSKLYVQLGDKFHCTDNLGTFKMIKIT